MLSLGPRMGVCFRSGMRVGLLSFFFELDFLEGLEEEQIHRTVLYLHFMEEQFCRISNSPCTFYFFANMMRVGLLSFFHFLLIQVNVDRIITMREELKNHEATYGARMTYMPMIIKAVSLALARFPRLNAVVDEKFENVIYKVSFLSLKPWISYSSKRTLLSWIGHS